MRASNAPGLDVSSKLHNLRAYVSACVNERLNCRGHNESSLIYLTCSIFLFKGMCSCEAFHLINVTVYLTFD